MKPTPEPHQAAIRYIRDKVNQLLAVLGTLPLRPEELDDDTLLELDPIGIVAGSFGQVLEHLKQTNDRLGLATAEIRAILDHISAAVVVLDRDERIDECNRRALDWFFGGAAAEQVIGRRADEVCACSAELAALRQGGDDAEHQLQLAGRDYQVIFSPILDGAGAHAKTVVLFADITRLKQAESGLQLYAQVFSNLGEGILITDRHNRIVEINQAFSRITGYTLEDLRGRTPKVLQSGLHDPDFYRDMWCSIEQRDFWRGETLDRAKDGRIIPMLQNISAVRNGEGELTHYISVVTDITSLKETQSRLDFLAHHDMLTDLPNRLLFNDRLRHAIEHARRDQSAVGLLFIDLDRFKTINDSLGHQVGDQLLKEAARRLKSLVRRADTVARLGGDEFVVLMERLAAPGDAVLLAEKLVAAFTEPFAIRGNELHVGCSIGVALYPEDGEDPVSLLRNADVAMYKAKEAGREAHVRYNSALSEASHRKLSLDHSLRMAVRDFRFRLHYQPIIDSGRRALVGVEALIRWPDGPPDGNTPDRFIPLAEETRLILPLGRWVLQEALGQFAAWRAEGLELDYVSVNISAVQIADRHFADQLVQLLRQTGVAGHQLQLEVTEHVLMTDMALCSRVLRDLREQRIRVAIDDFGTGYSSLAYLKQLPIDILKIDRSFVRDIPQDPNDCAIAAAVIGLARTLGLATIAEGIENAEQQRYLADIGCRLVQGYLYAPALPAGGLAAYSRTLGGQ